MKRALKLPKRTRKSKTRLVPLFLLGTGAAGVSVIPACAQDAAPGTADDMAFRGYPIDVSQGGFRDLAWPRSDDAAVPDMSVTDTKVEDFRGFPIDVTVRRFDFAMPKPDDAAAPTDGPAPADASASVDGPSKG